MRPTEDMTGAILITGLFNGDVCIYRTPLSYTKPIEFQLLKRFHPHTDWVSAISIHPTKPLFVTAGFHDHKVKIFVFGEVSNPLLIKCIEHPSVVGSVKYSHSGLLLTGCSFGFLHVYDVEPLCSLLWYCELPGSIGSVAWSPSNHIAASFHLAAAGGGAVRVWDSAFHTLFEHKQRDIVVGNYGLLFASDDLLICAGNDSNNLYSYNISKSEVATYRCTATVSAITALSDEIVCVACDDNMLRIYSRNNSVSCRHLRLLAALPCITIAPSSLASCMHACYDAGYVLAFGGFDKDVHISVTRRFNCYWVQKVMKIILNSKILPFCRDVDKIILRYLR